MHIHQGTENNTVFRNSTIFLVYPYNSYPSYQYTRPHDSREYNTLFSSLSSILSEPKPEPVKINQSTKKRMESSCNCAKKKRKTWNSYEYLIPDFDDEYSSRIMKRNSRHHKKPSNHGCHKRLETNTFYKWVLNFIGLVVEVLAFRIFDNWFKSEI